MENNINYDKFTEYADIGVSGLICNRAEILGDTIILYCDIGFIEIKHYQECCEDVTLTDYPDLSIFHNAVLYDLYCTVDRYSTNDGIEASTFYHFKTSRGQTSTVFHGSSNGYYGVSADYRIFIDNRLLFENEVDNAK